MSIFKSGLVKPVLMTCIKAIRENNISFEEGKTYELMLDMGSMYVLKTATGEEAIVPKDAFTPAKDG